MQTWRQLGWATLAMTVAAATSLAQQIHEDGRTRQRFDGDRPPQESIIAPEYAYADGGSANGGWGAFIGDETCAMHKFQALNGSDTITGISVNWSDLQPGQTARIAVWQAGFTGTVESCTLLHEQTVTVQNNRLVGFDYYTLSTPVNVTGTFYIGACNNTNVTGWSFGHAARFTNETVPGTAWLVTAPAPLNLSNLAAAPDIRNTYSESFFGPSVFLLRAHSGSPGFTYQGELKSGSSPFTGLADVRFQMFRGATGSDSVAPAQIVTGVNVDNGRFTVNVPVGDIKQFLDNVGDTFLEVSVRQAGSGSFNTLTPRQRMSSTPTAFAATYALEADSTRRLKNGEHAGPLLVTAGDPGIAPIFGAAWLSARGVGNGYMNLLGSDATETGVLFGKPTGGSANAGIVHNNGDTRDGLQFRTGGNTTRAVITSTGRLGVGTLVPEELVDVAGRLQVRGASAGETAGMWLASPLATPSKRAFVGLFNDSTVGLYGPVAGWGLTMNTSSGFVGVGRANPVTGADRFAIETGATANNYGGMYITTQAGGWPFYGFSVPGSSSCWTYFNGQTNTWHLFNNSERISVNSSGLVGIGTPPSSGGYRLELPNIASPAGQGRANAWVTYSSREYKDNIATLQDPISTIRQLRGVSFDWKAPLADGSRHHDIGFIAEEVGAVLPELVTRTADGNATGLDYGRVVPVAVEAIKHQQVRLENLEAENAALKARLDRLINEVEALRKK